MDDKEQSVVIQIMLVSVIRFIDSPSTKVSKLSKQIQAGLRKRYLKDKKNSSVRVVSPEYNKLNDIVMNAWNQTRRELVSEAQPLDSSLSEMIQYLYDRLNRNKYQNMYVSEKTVMSAINSIKDCPTNETRTEEELVTTENNSRLLCDRFLELCKIPKQHSLFTRKNIISQNLIIEKDKR